MQRIAALLVLLVFGLSQAGALECPMASRAADGARHAAAHTHHHAPSPTPADQHAPLHGQAGCAVVMACGTAAAPASGAVIALASARLSAAPGRLPHLYTSPVLNTESPPPRSSSAA